MDENQLKALYAFAYHSYEAEKYDDALKYFRILTSVEANEAKHWIGMAACYQMQHKYEDATSSYAIAAIMDEFNPEIHLNAAECFFKLKKKAEGKMALKSAETCINRIKDNKQLRSELALIRSKWDNSVH